MLPAAQRQHGTRIQGLVTQFPANTLISCRSKLTRFAEQEKGIKTKTRGPGEMAQQLRAQVALPEDLASIPST